jgi:hypothetical protein
MPDPYGGPWSLHLETAAEIRELCVQLSSRLFGVTDSQRLPPIRSSSGRRRRSIWRR